MAGIAALAIGYVLSQFYRSFLAVLTPALTAELGMTKADLSLASGAWFAVFALAQFAVGVGLDHYGPRRTTALMFGAFTGAGAFLFAASTGPWGVIAAMALIGLGCAPILMAMLFIFARNHSPARFAVLTSWAVAFGTAGNVLGAAPLAAASELFGWRPVLVALGIVTMLVAAAIAAFVRDPEGLTHAQGNSSGISGYVELLRMRVLWPIIPLVAINYAPPSGIRGLWAGPYLEDVFGLDTLAIGNVTLLMALAMVAGALFYGPLDTIFRTRKWIAIPGNTFCFAILLFLALNPQPALTVATILLVAIGFLSGSYGLLIAHPRSFIPAHLTGRGVTLMNFFSIGGVGAMQFATGGVVTAWSSPDDPTAAYAALFSFYALAVGVALFIYLFSRDARPERTG